MMVGPKKTTSLKQKGSDSMENVVTLVGQMGWPIASAILVMWFAYQLVIRGENERKEERESHQAEMAAITTAINANTDAIKANAVVLASVKEMLNTLKEIKGGAE